MKIHDRNRYNGEDICSGEAPSLKALIQSVVESNKKFAMANLAGQDLSVLDLGRIELTKPN